MSEKDKIYEQPAIDAISTGEKSSETIDLSAVKKILHDLNLVFSRLANKDVKEAESLNMHLEILENMIDENASAGEFHIFLIQLKTKVETSKCYFTVHETSVSNLCDKIIHGIEELLQA